MGRIQRVMSQVAVALWFSVGLFACSSVDVKTTKVVQVVHEQEDIAETELLDVGIRIFDPGIDNIDELAEDELVFPEIRVAESSFFPYLLMEAIQTSAAWGAVRVVPLSHDSVDVLVKGDILRSDGESMRIAVEVQDARGVRWFSKVYDQKASRYAYDKRQLRQQDPFQNIYNRIANDLNQYRRTMTSSERQSLRQISELKFAKSFAPDSFGQHVTEAENGQLVINRLPAEGDPMMNRIRQVRERDYLFIDTLQEYYGSYVKEMRQPYLQWRKESYNEVISMREMNERATNQKLIGAAGIIAGILGAGNADASVRAASAVAVAGGAYVLKAGFEREAEAQIHVDALQELGDSLQASIESHVIELEDRTVTLTGTVENQYKQWRNILQDIYRLDAGPATSGEITGKINN